MLQMALPAWQERVEKNASPKGPKRIAYNDTRKLFAVDASYSTVGEVMRAERECVLGLKRYV